MSETRHSSLRYCRTESLRQLPHPAFRMVGGAVALVAEDAFAQSVKVVVLHVHQVQQAGIDVYLRNDVLRFGLQRRIEDKERNVAVAQFPFLAPFIVVAGDGVVVAHDDDDAFVIKPECFERVDEAAHTAVHILRGDQIVFGLLVGDVGIVQRAFEVRLRVWSVSRHRNQLGIERLRQFFQDFESVFVEFFIGVTHRSAAQFAMIPVESVTLRGGLLIPVMAGVADQRCGGISSPCQRFGQRRIGVPAAVKTGCGPALERQESGVEHQLGVGRPTVLHLRQHPREIEHGCVLCQ